MSAIDRSREMPSEADARHTASEGGATTGIFLMLLAIGLFSTMDAMVKWLGQSYPTMQIMFFRSFFAFVPLALLIARMGGIAEALRVNNKRDHAIRCLVGLIGLSIFFYCFAHMKLADVVAISFAAPLFITALSVPMLGEHVGPRRWAACLVGFAGVLVMVNPGASLFGEMALLALVGTMFYALAIIYVRKLSKSETNASIVFYFTLTCVVVSGAVLPFQWVSPSPLDWALLIAVGLVGGLAQIIITQAFRLAEVSQVMPLEYTHMIWAVGFGFFIWAELPSLSTWIGVAIVTVSGLYIIYREAYLGRRRGVARRWHSRR